MRSRFFAICGVMIALLAVFAPSVASMFIGPLGSNEHAAATAMIIFGVVLLRFGQPHAASMIGMLLLAGGLSIFPMDVATISGVLGSLIGFTLLIGLGYAALIPETMYPNTAELARASFFTSLPFTTIFIAKLANGYEHHPDNFVGLVLLVGLVAVLFTPRIINHRLWEPGDAPRTTPREARRTVR